MSVHEVFVQGRDVHKALREAKQGQAIKLATIPAGAILLYSAYSVEKEGYLVRYALPDKEPPTAQVSVMPGASPDIEKRFKYHPPHGDQPQRYEKLREWAKHLAAMIDSLCPDSREKSLALTNLEQAVMWANASIARNEPKEVTSES